MSSYSRFFFIVRLEAATIQVLAKGLDGTVNSDRPVAFCQTLYPNSHCQAGPSTCQSRVNAHGPAHASVRKTNKSGPNKGGQKTWPTCPLERRSSESRSVAQGGPFETSLAHGASRTTRPLAAPKLRRPDPSSQNRVRLAFFSHPNWPGTAASNTTALFRTIGLGQPRRT